MTFLFSSKSNPSRGLLNMSLIKLYGVVQFRAISPKKKKTWKTIKSACDRQKITNSLGPRAHLLYYLVSQFFIYA